MLLIRNSSDYSFNHYQTIQQNNIVVFVGSWMNLQNHKFVMETSHTHLPQSYLFRNLNNLSYCLNSNLELYSIIEIQLLKM